MATHVCFLPLKGLKFSFDIDLFKKCLLSNFTKLLSVVTRVGQPTDQFKLKEFMKLLGWGISVAQSSILKLTMMILNFSNKKVVLH